MKVDVILINKKINILNFTEKSFFRNQIKIDENKCNYNGLQA